MHPPCQKGSVTLPSNTLKDSISPSFPYYIPKEQDSHSFIHSDVHKIIYTTTVPLSLATFCKGLLAELSTTYEIVAVSSPEKELVEVARHEKVRTIAVPMKRCISPLEDMISLIKLFWVYKHEKPQMVHSMTPKAGLLAMIAARIAGVPVRVHTFTGLVFPTATGFQKKLLMLTDRITCACATHIIPEGEGVKNDLSAYGITRKPMQVLGYGNVRGIDLAYYARTEEVMKAADAIRHHLHIPATAFTFIFIGRLVRDKGINELVTAFCNVQQDYPHIHLTLVGGEEEAALPIQEEIRQEIGRNPHIHAVEWQTDVRPWFALADAFVFPSYREGFPNAVIEAGAMGLPSIVTDINGSREIIRDGENGVIIPPHDRPALEQAMRTFVEQPDYIKQLVGQARTSIASRFEQGYVQQCLKDFYHQLLP